MLEATYRTISLPVSWGLAALFSTVERGRSRLSERLGDWRLPEGRYIWLHGASLGENQGLVPLIRKIKERCPEDRILLSATSISGLKNLEGIADELRLLPFDTPRFIERALSGVNLRAFIATETELWPNLLKILEYKKVPTALVNARISDLTAKSYQFFSSLFASGLNSFRAIAAADGVSFERFASLGMPNGRLQLTGNTKFDRLPSIVAESDVVSLRSEFFQNSDPVLVIGSLHHDELATWLPVLKRVRDESLAINIVLAPRRPERFPEFRERLSENDLKFHLRSEGRNAQDVRLVLLNSLGELERVYSIGDACFIGGTLNDLGGHNPLEAAQYGTAIALGTNVHTIREIVSQLIERDGVVTVRDTQDLQDYVTRVAKRDPTLKAIGQRSKEVWKLQNGATERVFGLLIEKGVL